MAKASDNVFPKIIVAEGTTPSSPAAGSQKLFVDSADHKLKRVDSSGTVTTVEGGSGGSGTYTYPPSSLDKPPTSPNAKDDEFDGTSTAPWASTPTAPTVGNITAYPDSYYIKTQANVSAYQGLIQPVPAAYPFTITAKLADFVFAGNSRAGIVIAAGNTASSNASFWGWVNNTNSLQQIQQQLGGTWNSNGSTASSVPRGNNYLRMVVSSATSVAIQYSTGRLWQTVTTINPGFTPAYMGFIASAESAGSGVVTEALFDFFRIT